MSWFIFAADVPNFFPRPVVLSKHTSPNPLHSPFHPYMAYVRADDCWMSANRSADGKQVADPTKFPNGFKAVADFIHNLGMQSG